MNDNSNSTDTSASFDLRTVNESLQADVRRLKQIIESNPQINVLLSSSFKVIDCNQAAVDIFG